MGPSKNRMTQNSEKYMLFYISSKIFFLDDPRTFQHIFKYVNFS